MPTRTDGPLLYRFGLVAVVALAIEVGHWYPFRLGTHCGIRSAYFGGRFWRARPVLSDGSDNPPRGWGNPDQIGQMRLVSERVAEFRADGDLVARFVPAGHSWRPDRCE